MEKVITKYMSGWITLIAAIILFLSSGYSMFVSFKNIDKIENVSIPILVLAIIFGVVVPILLLFCNITLQKNEAVVYTFMGEYKGTLKGSCYAALPFWWNCYQRHNLQIKNITIDKITVNDKTGNPIVIACNIYAHINNTFAATFDVSEVDKYLKSKGEVALRSIAKMYPMDTHDDENIISLRGNSDVISTALAKELSLSYGIAGYVLEDNPVGITTLTYAEEIAQVMLQRQQAIATVQARETITDGAVAIVSDKIEKIKNITTFSADQKANLVSSLLITLVSQHGSTPVFNVK